MHKWECPMPLPMLNACCSTTTGSCPMLAACSITTGSCPMLAAPQPQGHAQCLLPHNHRVTQNSSQPQGGAQCQMPQHQKSLRWPLCSHRIGTQHIHNQQACPLPTFKGAECKLLLQPQRCAQCLHSQVVGVLIPMSTTGSCL